MPAVLPALLPKTTAIPACILALALLGACSAPRHPLDAHLSRLRPVTVSALPDLGWPAGTLLCPMTPYQSAPVGDGPAEQRAKDYLARRGFTGDESHWSLVVIKPTPTGDAGMEHLVFRRIDYDVQMGSQMAEGLEQPAGALRMDAACIRVEQIRVLATRRANGDRPLLFFGTE